MFQFKRSGFHHLSTYLSNQFYGSVSPLELKLNDLGIKGMRFMRFIWNDEDYLLWGPWWSIRAQRKHYQRLRSMGKILKRIFSGTFSPVSVVFGGGICVISSSFLSSFHFALSFPVPCGWQAYPTTWAHPPLSVSDGVASPNRSPCHAKTIPDRNVPV